MKLSSLKPGMVVYDVQRHRMGNTTVITHSVYKVRVIEVHDNHIIASWNGNPPGKIFESGVKRLKKNEPIMIRSRMGYSRPATRAEKEALKSK
ncbi:hypothetical protein QLG07_05920 [Erwinia sp. V90_4]|uniref:hypothetical protein n=1 Tax=Erwinia sp. V90_4 TaxID=3044239 RepID=UPI00249EF78C|nr:hypothetical protein [Erwinia sp. V90_4]MDI3438981.1 hypothetical protein [Erwinia sp. V90_4]